MDVNAVILSDNGEMQFAIYALRAALTVSLLGCGRLNVDSRDSDTIDASDLGSVDGNVATTDAPAVANLAFITSSLYSGNLGGIDGANALCNQSAMNAGLSGDFVAFLHSPAQTDPTTQLTGSSGWKNAAGDWIAETRAQLANIELINPLLTENKTSPPSTWSGSGGKSCNGWTDASPLSAGRTKTWRAWGDANDGYGATSNCDGQFALACFERGHQATRVPPPLTKRLIFISRNTWGPQPGGRVSADALCTQEASNANRPGQFIALLPTDTEAAITRVNDAAAVFQRTNGEQFTLAPSPSTFLLEDATGTLLPGSSSYAWPGGDITKLPTNGCTSWQDTTPLGFIGFFKYLGNNYSDRGDASCSRSFHVYCVQQ
jgi:hypothetical protein